MMKITMLETFCLYFFCIFSLTWLFVGCFAWASLKMIQVKLVKTMMMMIMMDRWATITWCVVVNRKASSLHQYHQKIYNDFFATYFVFWEMATFIRPFLSFVFSHDAESRHWCLLALNDFSDVKSHLIRLNKSKVRLAVIVVVILHSNH